MGFFAQLSALWSKLTINQKAVFLLAVAVAVALVAASVFWAGRPDYVILYSNLKSEDASKIVDKLRSEKIPYRLTDGGKTVMVPSRRVYDMRLDLAAEGLPQASNVGFEIFDHPKLGMTDFMQKLNYQRALQGELVRTIEQMDEVAQARVHIVVPEPSLFSEGEREPTASVVLRMTGGASIGRSRVRGITHLVASSVEGLKPENVTVVDSYGNILAGGSEDELGAASTEQLYAQQSVEKYLRRKAQSMLESVIGPGKASVQVHAVLDFQRVKETFERYDDSNPVVRSEERTESTGEGGSGSQESMVTNYEISKSVKEVVNSSGTIQRLSVAVLVDGKYEKTDTGETQYVPRTEEELNQLAGLVKEAVGYDETRGDKVEIANIPFDNSRFEQQKREMERANKMRLVTQLGSKIGVGALILGLLLVVRTFFKKTAEVVSGGGRLEGGARVAELEGGQRLANQLEEQLAVLAKEKPLDVARLVRTWLKEE